MVLLGAKLLKATPKAVELMLTQLGGALPRELIGRVIAPFDLTIYSLSSCTRLHHGM